MISALLLLCSAKETVENLPLSFGSVTKSSGNTYTITTTINSLQSILTGSVGLSSADASRFVAKMKFSTENSILNHNFALSINPYSTSTRYATKTYRYIYAKKSGNNIVVKYSTMVAKMTVYSQIQTTTCKKFLWWEWDKKIEITWRPLTSSELNQVHNRISAVVDSAAKSMATSIKNQKNSYVANSYAVPARG